MSRPSRIARYVVRREVGSGGMGVVYAAYDPSLDRTVAVKLLRPDAFEGERRRRAGERLLREARSMARLAHPHVVPVYEVGEHEDGVFIAMEFVEGLSADLWLKECARPYREVLQTYFHAGLGLSAAHEAGLVHRDFKPANILVGIDGRARVTDFGLARNTPFEDDEGVLMDEQVLEATSPNLQLGDTLVSGITRTGLTAGTPAYMAPELFEGERPGPHTDQFAYCVALFEALYGVRPFPGRTAFAIAERMRNAQVEPPSPFSRVPGWLRSILLRGLRADPAERYPSMRALLAAIAFTDRVMG